MTKKERQKVFEKFDGRCAYTGKPLDDKWQVDHATSKVMHRFITYTTMIDYDQLQDKLKDVDNINNLLPAISIVNHYKRGYDIEGFRVRMKGLHKRLAKLPKKTIVERTAKRKKYLLEVAELFDINIDKPFSGVFYFEQILTNKQMT